MTVPDPHSIRWTPKRKAAVVSTICRGELSKAEACQRYALTAEELGYWMTNDKRGGTPALRVTRIQHYASAFAV